MSHLRLHARGLVGREVALAAVLSAGTAVLIELGSHRLGTIGALLLPLGLVAILILLLRPVLCMCLTVGLAVVCQGPAFGLLTFQSHLYDSVYKRLTPLDVLVLLAIAAAGIDMIRTRRRLRIPRELRMLDVFMVLAMISGIVVGRAAGGSTKFLFLSVNVFLYVVLLPLAIANLDIDARRMRTLMAVLYGAAVYTAIIGLVELVAGKGIEVEAGASLTFYEPTPNWLVMIALLGIVAAVVGRVRPPRWMVASAPLLLVETILSYRRSFWVATALGLVLVVLLALSPLGRRLLVPVALLVAVAIWIIGSVNFQSSSPIVKRLTSLSPSKLTTNVQDRYRLDERANVLADLKRHPVSGLGLLVPWEASKQPLSVEHQGGREYVHFGALYWWMKLGILGLASYVLLLASMALFAWKVWRRGREPAVRTFGLASLCATAGLLAAETTATFLGDELRFSVVLVAQIGLLAWLAANACDEEPVGEEPPAAPPQSARRLAAVA